MARVAMVFVLAAMLAGCSGDPVDPASISRPDEVQAGPGLLTGPSGAYELRL